MNNATNNAKKDTRKDALNNAADNRGRAARGPRIVAALITCWVLAGCTGGAPSGGATDGAPSGAVTTTTTAPPSVPVREAREGWKVFSDPARLLSFELPVDWVVQPLEPEPGAYSPDSLHYTVRTPEGITAAELHTGILTQEPPCPETERTPYYVIASEPVQLMSDPPAATDIEPRFVVRLITGFRFFGSYGLTDQVGGADGLGCSLPNTVDGGGVLGRVSFGDLEVLAPRLPADTGPRTVSFGTIGEAEAHYGTPEFVTVRQMVQSLRLAPPPQ